MAKRELSATLKNLKFMQRANQKEEQAKKEEEVVPAGDFPASSPAVKRCVVIVEGDPHPGATRGRMSFQSFNPSIDKLNEVASSPSRTESAATSSGRKNESIIRENGSTQCGSDDVELETSNDDVNCNGKRKQHEIDVEPEHPNKSRKSNQDNQDSNTGRNRSSQKLNKREKLDWNVLLPPKHQSKKR